MKDCNLASHRLPKNVRENTRAASPRSGVRLNNAQNCYAYSNAFGRYPHHDDCIGDLAE